MRLREKQAGKPLYEFIITSKNIVMYMLDIIDSSACDQSFPRTTNVGTVSRHPNVASPRDYLCSVCSVCMIKKANE